MQRNHKLLILSFFLLNLFLWISIVEPIYGIPSVVKYVLSFTVMSMVIYYRLTNPSKQLPAGVFYSIIIAFIIWSIILLLLQVPKFSDISYLRRILWDRYFLIPFLFPLILLFTKFDLKFFSYYFHYSYLLIIPAVIIQLSVIILGISQNDWYEQSHRILIFDIGGSFLLMTAHLSRKRSVSLVIVFYFIVWIFLWAAYGRRGMLIENILLFIFMIIIRLRSSLIRSTERMKIYFFGLVIIILFLSFGYLFTSSYAFQRGFGHRSFEESRGMVFDAFFYDFRSSTDWIFGRGIDGTILRAINMDERFTTIENGFLIIILKGGLIYTVPFILILLRASYLGFFRSNNDMSKAMASLLLIHVIIMAYFNLPDYSPKYIFIWIAVSACFAPEIRQYSNDEVYLAINSRFK